MAAKTRTVNRNRPSRIVVCLGADPFADYLSTVQLAKKVSHRLVNITLNSNSSEVEFLPADITFRLT